MEYTCPYCRTTNGIVNQCGCDPHNLPTVPHYTLRLLGMEHVLADTPMLKLPVVLTGTSDECKAYAEGRGYVFNPCRKYLFGGYWHKPARAGGEDAGTCLLPT